MDTNKVQFLFSKNISSRLGEDLNSNQGILELVKNSFDADPINNTIELSDISISCGTIHIFDDGDDMNIEE